MALIKTYICDVSGKQSNLAEDFFSVSIESTEIRADGNHYRGGSKNCSVIKLVHKEVANKLGLIKTNIKTEEIVPEVTFESQLTVLLKDYINEIVYEEVSTQISSRN